MGDNLQLVAILGDVHFGKRADSSFFMDYDERFYSEVFFPHLVKNNIKTIIQLGDFFDRRKYVNFLTLKRTYDMFVDKLVEYGIKMYIFAGNHDTFYKNTNSINSLDLLLSHCPYIEIIKEAANVKIMGTKICMVPWLALDNYEAALDVINKTDAKICMGHFEIAGFSMYKDMHAEEGLDREMFSKFDLTLSGHYHHRSQQGSITYVGTPMQITWQDFEDDKGFHTLDLETNDLVFIKNPFEMFHHVYYDDKTQSIAEINAVAMEAYKDVYVKVIVINKSNPYLFDKFLKRLYEANPVDVMIVENFIEIPDMEEESSSLEEAEDTMTIINKYIDVTTDENIDVNRLKTVMRDLYNDAVNGENP